MDTRFGMGLRSSAAARLRFTPILGPSCKWVNLHACWPAS